MSPTYVTTKGNTVRQVRCACGARYAYRLEREATGSFHGFALTAEAAAEKASQAAGAKLAELLKTGIEACKCPQCGTITAAMREKLENDRANHIPIMGGTLLLGIALGAVTWWLGGRAHDRLVGNELSRGFRLGLDTLVLGGISLVSLGIGILGLWGGHRDKFVEPLAGDGNELAPPAAR